MINNPKQLRIPNQKYDNLTRGTISRSFFQNSFAGLRDWHRADARGKPSLHFQPVRHRRSQIRNKIYLALQRDFERRGLCLKILQILQRARALLPEHDRLHEGGPQIQAVEIRSQLNTGRHKRFTAVANLCELFLALLEQRTQI